MRSLHMVGILLHLHSRRPTGLYIIYNTTTLTCRISIIVATALSLSTTQLLPPPSLQPEYPVPVQGTASSAESLTHALADAQEPVQKGDQADGSKHGGKDNADVCVGRNSILSFSLDAPVIQSPEKLKAPVLLCAGL